MPDEKKIERKIRTTMLRRTAYFDRKTVDMDKRTVELAFSSEEPVSRWFGEEILDHDPKSVRLKRLKKTGPLLIGHDSIEHVGTVKDASIDSDRVGRAVVRFGTGPERDQYLQDVEDGIRKCVSVGYRIHRMKLEEQGDDVPDIYRAIDWEPYEISLVSMPADTSVGVGREAREWHSGDSGEHDTIIIELTKKEAVMPPDEKPGKKEKPEVRVETTDSQADEIRAQERTRAGLINEVGERFNKQELAQKSIADGDSLADFNAKLLDSMPGAKKKEAATSSPEDLNIGMDKKEQKRFSFLRLIRAQAFGQADPRFIEQAAFEIECSRAAMKKYKQTPQGHIVPTDVLLYGDRDRTKDWRALKAFEDMLISQRVLTEGVAGASVIAEDLLSGSFIDLLRNRSVLQSLGVTMLDGLEGDIAIPRQSGAGTAFWLATDETDITESTQTLDQVTMTPRNVGAFSVYTRQLLMQSSIAIEQFVRNDLATVLALAIDLAGLYGTGAGGQPTGVANTAGINAPGIVAGGAPTNAELVNFETVVATDNALNGTLAYLIEATMRGYLKTTEKVATTGIFMWESGNTVNGYRTEVTEQVTLDDIFFGNWADLLQGAWGGLDVLVDPFTLSARMNTRVIEMWSTDFAVRHPESFAFDNET